MQDLVTERFELRILKPDSHSLSNYLKWIRDRESNPFIHGINELETLENLIGYVNEKNQMNNALLLGIFLKGSLEHIGNVKLEPILPDYTATIGILVGEESWRGKGVGFEVLSEVLNYAFTALSLQMIKLGVNEKNFAAIELYKKLGFTNSELSLSQESFEMRIDAVTWLSDNNFN